VAESDLMRSLQIEASSLGARLFRQNVGLAWTGDVRRNRDGSITISNPRPMRFGVPGMSDLGGYVPVTITHGMVGGWLAVYTQVEVKQSARVTDEQRHWIDIVNAAGGRAGIARSSDDLRQILQIP
jgi:hypothetical protein